MPAGLSPPRCRYADYQAATSCFIPWFPSSPKAQPRARRLSASQKAPTGAAKAKVTRERRGKKADEAGPATPAVTVTEDVAEVVEQPQQQEEVAAKRRGGRARQTKKAAAAAEEQTAEEPGPSTSSRPVRSPRKTARALAAEQPAPVRQSSRLRTKSGSSSSS